MHNKQNDFEKSWTTYDGAHDIHINTVMCTYMFAPDFGKEIPDNVIKAISHVAISFIKAFLISRQPYMITEWRYTLQDHDSALVITVSFSRDVDMLTDIEGSSLANMLETLVEGLCRNYIETSE